MPRRWKEVVPDRCGVLWTHWLRCTLQIWCVHTGSEPSTVDITSHRDGPTTATSRLYTVDYIEMIDGSVVFDASTFTGSWEGRKKERKDGGGKKERNSRDMPENHYLPFAAIFMKGPLNNP